VNEAISAISFGQLFRDGFGWRLDRGNTKIIPLQIFNLQGQLPSVRFSVNQWVPGSSPGRGANSLFYLLKNLFSRQYAGILNASRKAFT
jgi:hypothetical protein